MSNEFGDADPTTCEHDDGLAYNFCRLCGHAKPGRLEGLRLQHFTGSASLSPKMDYFWNTGDPAVFSEPGSPDYDPALDAL